MIGKEVSGRLLAGAILLLGVAVSSVPLFAQITPDYSAPGLSLLDVSFGARGLALAEVMQAMPADRFSIYNNPATSAFSDQIVVMAGGQNMWPVNTAGFIGVFPFSFGTFSIGMKGANVGGIEVRPDPADPGWVADTTDASALSPALSFATRFANTSVGLTLRAQVVNLGTNPYVPTPEGYAQLFAASVGVDVGVYQEIGDLGIGFVVQNLGPRMYFDLGEDSLSEAENEGTAQPLYIGGSVRYALLEQKLQLLGGAGYGSRGLVISGAVEYAPWRVLALRLGYTTERMSGYFFNGLTTGLGLRLANLEINYSYLPNSYLGAGGIHGVDVGFHFGASEAQKEQFLAEAREQAGKESLERMKLTSQSLYQQGMSQYNMDRYEDALSSWDLALIWWPENEEARGMIEKVNAEKEQKALEALIEDAKQAYVSENYVALVVLTEQILAEDSTHSLALFYRTEAEKGYTKELIANSPTAVQEDLRSGIQALADQDYLTAMRSFESVLDYDPGNAVAQDYIRKTQAEINRYINGKMDEVNSLLGRNRYNEAKAVVRDLLQLAPQNQDLLQKLGEIDRKLSEDVQRRIERAQEAEDAARAERELATALQLDPGNQQAREGLQEIQQDSSRRSSADVQQLYLLGVESYSEHNYELAISYWQRVLAADPNHANARKNLERAQSKLAALGG